MLTLFEKKRQTPKALFEKKRQTPKVCEAKESSIWA